MLEVLHELRRQALGVGVTTATFNRAFVVELPRAVLGHRSSLAVHGEYRLCEVGALRHRSLPHLLAALLLPLGLLDLLQAQVQAVLRHHIELVTVTVNAAIFVLSLCDVLLLHSRQRPGLRDLDLWLRRACTDPRFALHFHLEIVGREDWPQLRTRFLHRFSAIFGRNLVVKGQTTSMN